MKKLLLFFFFAAVSYLASAQDIIVTNDAETIKAYNIEVGPSAVFYSSSAAANAEIKRIAKSDILIIKYADGRKWTNAGENATVAVSAPKTDGVSPDNAKYIAEFNSRCENLCSRFIVNDKPKKPKKLKSAYYFGVLNVTDDSVLSDGTLKIDICKGHIDLKLQKEPPYYDFSKGNSLSPYYNHASGYYYYNSSYDWHPAWQLVLENQSSDYIYVNLSSCYLKADGKIYSFFDPRQSDIISTDSSSSSLLRANSAATKGSVSSSVTSKNISIAPHSSVNTFAVVIDCVISSVYNSFFVDDYLGCFHDFSIDQSPYKMDIHAVWSKDENAKGTKWLHASMFLSKTVPFYDSYQGYSSKDNGNLSIPSNYPIIVFDRP